MPDEPPQFDTGLHCPKCGYNLTAVAFNRCPECGEPFILTNAQGYLARFPPSRLRQVCNAAWMIGTVMIILSWTRTIPPWMGWIGFGISLLAWGVSSSLRRR